MSEVMFDFEQLTRTKQVEGKPHVLVRAGLSLFFYCDVMAPEMAPQVAQALEAYLAFIPKGTLQSYLANDGYYKPLTSRQLNKDLKLLRNMPPDYQDYRLAYNQGLLGQVGTHGIWFESMLDASSYRETFPFATNPVQLDFPPSVLDDEGIERFLAFVIDIANILPFQTGNVGYAFQHTSIFSGASVQQINQMLPRFMGFDPAFDQACDEMKDHTPAAHWLNLLNTRMIEKLGGLESLRKQLPGVEFLPLKNGVILRASRRPPIGDVNRQARDIGLLPTVARALKPTRFQANGFGQKREIFDAMAWLARFDAMPSQPWEQP